MQCSFRLLAPTVLLACLLPLVPHSAPAAGKKDYVPEYPSDLKVEADVVFLPGDRKEKLDIYHPVGVPEGQLAPAVIYFHGGGFNDGDKARTREISICSDLARAGFLAVSANYKLRRMQGQVTWPRNIHDCKLAVQWVRANASKLGIDPDRIGVMGGSAGGTIAALLGYTQPEDGLEAPDGNPQVPTHVACVVDFYGPMDLLSYRDMKMFAQTREEAPELYRQASPVTYIDAGDPPTLIVHGTADDTVKVEQSELLATKLKEAGVEHELIIIPHAPHTFDLRPLQMDLKPAVFAFLRKHLGGAASTAP